MQDSLYKASHVHRNVAETDFQFERTHPGEVYFPWDPLAALMASGKLYHFDYGVEDRILAGFPPSDEQLHAWIPANAQWIALPPEPCASFVMQSRLPEFAGGSGSSMDDLPGYILVKRHIVK